jgi:hypothetical protein
MSGGTAMELEKKTLESIGNYVRRTWARGCLKLAPYRRRRFRRLAPAEAFQTASCLNG